MFQGVVVCKENQTGLHRFEVKSLCLLTYFPPFPGSHSPNVWKEMALSLSHSFPDIVLCLESCLIQTLPFCVLQKYERSVLTNFQSWKGG